MHEYGVEPHETKLHIFPYSTRSGCGVGLSEGDVHTMREWQISVLVMIVSTFGFSFCRW